MTQPQLTDSEYRLALMAVLGRIAGALEGAAQRDNAHDDTLVFPLGDYPSFDWAKIGATVVQSDEFGVSVIRAANGRMATRRTNEKFGTEIWFSYAIGKNADDTPKYQRVIEFREIKPPEPIGRKTEQALKTAKPTSPALNPPVATLGERMTAQQPTTTQPRIEIPASLRSEWLQWHDQAAKFGPVPAELGLYEADTIASVTAKIASLTKLAESGAVAAGQVLLDQLAMSLAEAKEAGVEVPPEFYETAGVAFSVIELRIGTVKNLLAAKQGAQSMTQSPQQQIAGVAGQQVITTLLDMAAKSASRTMSQSMAFDTVSALEYIAGSEPARHAFCQRVFGIARFADLKDPQRYALFSWLKPARAAGNKAQPTNPKAASEMAAVMAMQPEVTA